MKPNFIVLPPDFIDDAKVIFPELFENDPLILSVDHFFGEVTCAGCGKLLSVSTAGHECGRITIDAVAVDVPEREGFKMRDDAILRMRLGLVDWPPPHISGT